METLRIDIVNPKAKKIIKDLADLNLISIRDKDPVKAFQGLLNKLRRSKTDVISLDEITREVELVEQNGMARKVDRIVITPIFGSVS